MGLSIMCPNAIGLLVGKEKELLVKDWCSFILY